MKKYFWGPKMHFLFFDFYHKISYGENDFVIQNHFLNRKFYGKNQKMKNAFLDPKKTFSYKTYEKNFVLLKKFAL